MPELPDLEVFSRNLDKKLSGKKLEKLTIENTSKLKTPVATFKKELEKQELLKVYRAGKELHFKFANDNILGLHLMLNGELFLFKDRHDQKHAIIELLFEDKTGLVLTDYQGIATPTLNPEPWDAPDALSEEMNEAFLTQKLSKKKAVIKTVLLDQHVVRGIGNAYADEILWDAGISPFSLSNKIPEAKIKDLVTSIKTVLRDAVTQILHTNPHIITGEVRDFLKVHQHRKTHSPTGGVIHQKLANSRKTYYTDEQELFQ